MSHTAWVEETLPSDKGTGPSPSRSCPSRLPYCVFMTENSKNAVFLIAVKHVFVCVTDDQCQMQILFFYDDNSKAQCWLLVSIQIPMLLGDVLGLLHRETLHGFGFF